MTDSASVLGKGSRRVGVIAAHSVDRFVFTVPDLDVAAKFYVAFGLDVYRYPDRLDLYTHGHSHCWGTIYAGGQRKQLQYICYGIFAADEAFFARRIAEEGIAAEAHTLGKPGGLWLRDPDGVAIQLVVADKVSPSAKCQAVLSTPPQPGQGAAPSRSKVKPVRPRHLSHLLRFTPDVPRMIRFSEEVLGLRLSDHSGDGIAFMHTPHGSDHHLVAFAKSHAPGLHHTSWDVGSFEEVGRGAEQMRSAGWDQGWGIGRHVLGSNYFYYVRDPWGSFCEYTFDIDFVASDVDWPAADHAPEDSLYVWGPPLPADFITNHEYPTTQPEQ